MYNNKDFAYILLFRNSFIFVAYLYKIVHLRNNTILYNNTLIQLIESLMASWECVQDCVVDPSIRLILKRQPHILAEYEAYMEHVQKSYVKYSDYIIETFLTPAKITFARNKFPYNVAYGIQHYNIWSHTPLSSDEITTELAKYFEDPYEPLWFVNEPSMMSVPEVWHCHVFSRQPCPI